MKDEVVKAGCGEGWESLYAPLIERCQAEGVAILQIKQKFGGLRFYVMGGSDELHAAIEAAEAKSFTVCEECGARGELRKGAYWQSLCDPHAQARRCR
jgi:Tfp pilus assembly protein PilV